MRRGADGRVALHVVAELPLHSVLAVGQGWALGGPDEPASAPRAECLLGLPCFEGQALVSLSPPSRTE